MTYPDSVAYLYQIGNELKHGRLGLERIQAIVEALDNPQRRFKVVHVAGTNGKGSTCAMIAAGLRGAGHRVGLYTSPHLVEPRERIQINGQSISGPEFVSAFGRVQAVNRQLLQNGVIDLHTTYFETITAMGFHAFAEANVDWAVIEVGLGGKLDATNVVSPDICVITPIGLDHQEYLGNTLAEIATEKAGILKPGVPVIVAPQQPEAEEVILRRAAELGCPVTLASSFPLSDVESLPFETRFCVNQLNVAVPLGGRFQSENGAVAVLALQQLGLTPNAIQTGLLRVEWPGRLERVCERPLVILDGAHNTPGAIVLANHLKEHIQPHRQIHLIFGLMQDKPLDEMIEVLFPLADQIVATRPNSTRAVDPKVIQMAARPRKVRVVEEPEDALHLIDRVSALDAVVVCGSLYLVGEVRPFLVHEAKSTSAAG